MGRRARWLLACLLGLALLSGCGGSETRRIADGLVRAQRRAGEVPVKLLATVQPGGSDLLIFYQWRNDKLQIPTCGSGAALLHTDLPEQWLDEEHPCATTDRAISGGTTGKLGAFLLTYGLVFDAQVSRVTVSFHGEQATEASLRGGAWWLLRREGLGDQPDTVTAYDRSGKQLLSLRHSA